MKHRDIKKRGRGSVITVHLTLVLLHFIISKDTNILLDKRGTRKTEHARYLVEGIISNLLPKREKEKTKNLIKDKNSYDTNRVGKEREVLT